MTGVVQTFVQNGYVGRPFNMEDVANGGIPRLSAAVPRCRGIRSFRIPTRSGARQFYRQARRVLPVTPPNPSSLRLLNDMRLRGRRCGIIQPDPVSADCFMRPASVRVSARHEQPASATYTLRLIAARVDFHIRETFESALMFGHSVLTELGLPSDQADEAIADVRRRDKERLELQVVGGLTAGRSLWRGNMPTPMPELFTPPRAAPSTAVVEPERS